MRRNVTKYHFNNVVTNMYIRPRTAMRGKLADRTDIFEDADDGSLGPVDPRTKAGIAAVIVSEFVSQHSAKLGNSHRRKQRQAQSHDAAAAKSHDPAAIGDEGIGVANQINFARNGFVESRGDAVDFGEKTRIGGAFEEHSGGGECVAARDERPEHGSGDDDAKEKQKNNGAGSRI